MDIKELGINLNIDSPSINFNQLREQLPYEDIRGYIVNKSGDKQSLIEYKKEYYRGGYGKLFLVKRTTSRSEFCLVKIPIYKDSDLLKEAILQFMSYKTLKTLKMYKLWCINTIVLICLLSPRIDLGIQAHKTHVITTSLREHKN